MPIGPRTHADKFRHWWEEEGSECGGHDHTFSHKETAEIAWQNGAYCESLVSARHWKCIEVMSKCMNDSDLEIGRLHGVVTKLKRKIELLKEGITDG